MYMFMKLRSSYSLKYVAKRRKKYAQVQTLTQKLKKRSKDLIRKNDKKKVHHARIATDNRLENGNTFNIPRILFTNKRGKLNLPIVSTSLLSCLG